tara:strand:+ start:4267 stop:4680 length:414 start_codon:yes stop_codon:yes gene_type:complete
MQPRKCPQCGKTISDDANYSFDDDLNLICGGCGKIAFPTSWKTNSEVDSAIRELKGGWGTQSWQQNDHQSTFPKQTYGNVGNRTHTNGANGASRTVGPLGRVHGLSGGGTQVPNRSGNQQFPADDVDDYSEPMPFYA